MVDLSVPLSGLQASVAQLSASAANIANAETSPVGVEQTTTENGGVAAHQVSLKTSDFAADLVGQTMALANYRANLAVIDAQSRMSKVTLDLIG
jgi:flagellar basal body rod protein FlgC